MIIPHVTCDPQYEMVRQIFLSTFGDSGLSRLPELWECVLFICSYVFLPNPHSNSGGVDYLPDIVSSWCWPCTLGLQSRGSKSPHQLETLHSPMSDLSSLVPKYRSKHVHRLQLVAQPRRHLHLSISSTGDHSWKKWFWLRDPGFWGVFFLIFTFTFHLSIFSTGDTCLRVINHSIIQTPRVLASEPTIFLPEWLCLHWYGSHLSYQSPRARL